MMKTLKHSLSRAVLVAVGGVLAVTAMSASGGKLGSFEKSVGGSSKSSDDSSSDNSGSLGSFERSTSSRRSRRSSSYYRGYPGYYHDCWYCRYHHDCLFHYHHHPYYHGIDAPPRIAPPPSGTNAWDDAEFESVPGSPILPLARFDFAWQSVEDDVDAYDYALEVGYSALAVRGRLTNYREDEPGDTLDLSSLLLLWRIPLTRNVELDAGLGGAELEGEDSQSGLDFTLALRGWIPDRHVGFEYRGEFIDIGDGLSSHDICVLVHVKWVALRGGYRWLHSTGDSLDGPFAGAAVIF